MQRARQYSLGTLSELNVTPLLDLAFVMLVIFMITAPFLAERSDLTIPSSKASHDAVDPSKVITLSVDKFNRLELDETPVATASLVSELQALKAQKPGLGILVRAHANLPVQRLVEVMDAMRNAGIATVGVVTKPDGD
ncbi:MAG: biopolymer transporter ExbD [Verrucomicrobiota bacterium]